jgi:hypothetical protein
MNFGRTSTVERTRPVDTPLVLLWARLELNQLANWPSVYSASRFPETSPEPINDESRLGHTGRLSTGNKPREKRPTSPAPDWPMRGDSGHNLARLRSRETWVGWIASRSASVSIPSMVQGASTVKYQTRLPGATTPRPCAPAIHARLATAYTLFARRRVTNSRASTCSPFSKSRCPSSSSCSSSARSSGPYRRKDPRS